jgi:hypothetical protein
MVYSEKIAVDNTYPSVKGAKIQGRLLSNLPPTRPSQATQGLTPQPQRQIKTEPTHPGTYSPNCDDIHHDSSKQSVSTITPPMSTASQQIDTPDCGNEAK